MSSYLRDKFGLTQERLASWLGVGRGALAMSESGQRTLPINSGVQEARLVLASLGRVYNPTAPAEAQPAPPPLPTPAPELDEVAWRARECRVLAMRTQRQLDALRTQATQLEARLAALPALRAYPGPVANPTRETGWLALLEGEAEDGLRTHCGRGAQRLLEARLAGLEREAELLEALLAEAPLTPEPGQTPPGSVL
jgi:DNA-binding XRE family transcriptional regulator